MMVMMKLVVGLVGTVAALAHTQKNEIILPRLSFDDLNEATTDLNALLHPLQDVGMIAISDLPNHFSKHKAVMLDRLAACMQEKETVGEIVLEDGHTVRKTLGLEWDGDEKVADSFGDSPSCRELEHASASVRETVSLVSETVAQALQAALGLDKTPLLFAQEESSSSSQESFLLQDICQQGHQIEHFHAYYNSAERSATQQDISIDWHIDQGLFLLFVPGSIRGTPTEGFYVQDQDGVARMVQFQPNQDDLILMLGDGVNQYVNHKSAVPLRAVPHALVLPPGSIEPRVWYGRMVLPPSTAQHPMHAQLSYGQLRDEMSRGNSAAALGCSSPAMHARMLDSHTGHGAGNGHDNNNCTHGTFPCWHLCQNITVTNAECQADGGKELQCVMDWKDANDVIVERLLWDGGHRNPQFFPGCIDKSTATVYDPALHGPPTAAPSVADDSPSDDDSSGGSIVTGSALLLSLVGMLTAVAL